MKPRITFGYIPVFGNAQITWGIAFQPARAQRIPNAALINAARRVECIPHGKKEEARNEHKEHNALPWVPLIPPEAAPPKPGIRRRERLRGEEAERVIHAAQQAKRKQQTG